MPGVLAFACCCVNAIIEAGCGVPPWSQFAALRGSRVPFMIIASMNPNPTIPASSGEINGDVRSSSPNTIPAPTYLGGHGKVWHECISCHVIIPALITNPVIIAR